MDEPSIARNSITERVQLIERRKSEPERKKQAAMQNRAEDHVLASPVRGEIGRD